MHANMYEIPGLLRILWANWGKNIPSWQEIKNLIAKLFFKTGLIHQYNLT